MLRITLQILVDVTNIYMMLLVTLCVHIYMFIYTSYITLDHVTFSNYNPITWVYIVNYNTLFLFAKWDLVILQAKLQVLNLHF